MQKKHKLKIPAKVTKNLSRIYKEFLQLSEKVNNVKTGKDVKVPHKRCLKGKKHKTKSLTPPVLREMQTKPQRHTIPSVTATPHVQKRDSTERWGRGCCDQQS